MALALTIPEAAAELRISPATARRWAATGKLPVVVFSERTRRVPLDALQELLRPVGDPNRRGSLR